MKRLLRAVPALVAPLIAATARADLIVSPQEVSFEIRPQTPLDVLLEHLPMILIVALLIVTALLVRRFTRRGKK